ncbi:hypothetical protein ACIF2S_12625 [Pseudomonas taetrolens]|uniref:hypothetical protein n=1 Tax=Pseudomonas TaxID=286 RepID=UPI001C4FD8F5|nr:hypothetical protein [Pseudomonas sp. D1HM]
MKSNATSYCVVLCACILVALGDIRSLISPAGYWAIWCLVGIFGYASKGCVFSFRVSPELFTYLAGFFMVVMSFVLSAIMNSDVATLYQGVKICCVAAIFVCIYIHAQHLEGRQFYAISVTVLCVGLLFFLMSKYAVPAFYVVLGDGRQGSLFAFPGVLWKTCAFFIGFVIVGMLFDGRAKKIAVTAFIIGFYLLIADSSRTGFIIFALVVFLMGLLGLYTRPKTVVGAFIVCVCAGILGLLLYSGGFTSMNPDDAPLVLDRLAAGDPVRMQMLVDGVAHSLECLPLGCGFGTTVSDVEGGVMVVHNAYLSSVGDLGLGGLMGLAILMFSPVLFFFTRLYKYSALKYKPARDLAYAVAAFGGVAGYILLLMLHPFSTELSEWGIWIVMVSALSVMSQRMTIDDPELKYQLGA